MCNQIHRNHCEISYTQLCSYSPSEGSTTGRKRIAGILQICFGDGIIRQDSRDFTHAPVPPIFRHGLQLEADEVSKGQLSMLKKFYFPRR
jgi:hypothetical protein